jgi:hypothetical protein
MIESDRLQRALHSRPHLDPLMTVPQQAAQISLLAARHPDGGETILHQQLQRQPGIPPIVLRAAHGTFVPGRQLTSDVSFH